MTAGPPAWHAVPMTTRSCAVRRPPSASGAALRLRIAGLERHIAVLLEETSHSSADVPALVRALNARRALYAALDGALHGALDGERTGA